jgi:predicted aspartyl protease/Flp pilus assembly protein TadD
MFALVFCRFRRLLTVVLVLALACCRAALAVSCHVVPAHPPTDAQQAFLHSDYEKAVELYQAQLAKNPNDTDSVSGLALVLLREQKVKEAADLVQKALATAPQAVNLVTTMGEIQYRQGLPWSAAASVDAALKLDACYAEAYLLRAMLLRLNSDYASAAQDLKNAYLLNPHDPQIRLEWLQTLPIDQQIKELEAYLASGGGDDPEETKNLQFELAFLKQAQITPPKACRLVSKANSATLPFAMIMSDATHIRAFGLDVKLNNHNARLQVDTGAGGLVISRSVANRAGLQVFSKNEAGGIGSEGRKASYTAFVDDIKIGQLEFQNCAVEVIDQHSVIDLDGLIGMNVLSPFLITLDYPVRQIRLSPLPPRPGEAPAAQQPRLETGTASSEAASAHSADKGTQINPNLHDRYVAPEMKDWTHVFRIGHDLLIPASLNNALPKIFILDTGAFNTTITPEAAREITKVRSDDRQVYGINGKVDKVYSADDVTFRFAQVSQKVQDVVTFEIPNLSKDLNMEISGLIGFNTLGQLTVNIDYRDGLVKFDYDPKRGYHVNNSYF